MNYINEYYQKQKSLSVEEVQIQNENENIQIANELNMFIQDFVLYQDISQKANRESKTKPFEERFDLFGETQFGKYNYGNYKLVVHTLGIIQQNEPIINYVYRHRDSRQYEGETKRINAEDVDIIYKDKRYMYGRIKETNEEINIVNSISEYKKEVHYIYDLINQKCIDKKEFKEGAYKDIRYETQSDYKADVSKAESISFGMTSIIPIFKHIENGELILSIVSMNQTKYSIKATLYPNNFYKVNLINGTVKRISQLIDGQVNERDHTDFSDLSNIYISSYLEELYGIEPNTLPKDINLGQYLTLLKYTNNLFQSFLQTGSKTPWFLSNLTKTIRASGKPIQDKNIQTWLDLSLPDFKYLLSQPNQDMLIHFMIANKYKPVSLQEFLKTESKIIELNNKWLKEFDKRKSVTSVNPHENVIFKNNRNKYLFSSSTLPQFMVTYVNKGIYHNHSLYRYLKYIIDEGKKSYDKENGTYLTLKDIETYLIDYNQMLKEINPKSKFMLPYKIKNAHDTMVINYNDIMAERRAMAGDYDWGKSKLVAKYSKADHARYTDDRYMMVAPYTMMDLHDEGSNLNHCVGGYGRRIESGECLIYFLREKQQPNKSLVTVELRKINEQFYVNQSRGQGNRLENGAERMFIQKWLKDYQLSYEERKEELAKEAKDRLAKLKDEQMKINKYSIHIIEALKLCGYAQVEYDETISKKENYEKVIQDGLIEYTLKMLIEDTYNDESLESAIDCIKQAVKKEGFKQKDIQIISKEDVLLKAQTYYTTTQIVDLQQER